MKGNAVFVVILTLAIFSRAGKHIHNLHNAHLTIISPLSPPLRLAGADVSPKIRTVAGDVQVVLARGAALGVVEVAPDGAENIRGVPLFDQVNATVFQVRRAEAHGGWGGSLVI